MKAVSMRSFNNRSWYETYRPWKSESFRRKGSSGCYLELRGIVTVAAPLECVAPAVPAPDDILEHWLAVAQIFPYVSSAFDKVHRVVVGYPEHPRLWRTRCGWPFGMSEVAVPAVSMPRCHLAMCEPCCKVERGVAKAEAAIRVSEVGVD